MRVYVATPINTANGYDPQQAFRAVGDIVRGYGLEPILPSDPVRLEVWFQVEQNDQPSLLRISSPDHGTVLSVPQHLQTVKELLNG